MFLGYSESLFKIATGFEMVEVGGTFAYFKPKIPRAQRPPPEPLAPPRPSAPRPSEPFLSRPLTPLVGLSRLDPKPPLPWLTPPPPRIAEASPPVKPDPAPTPVERLRVVVAAIDTGDFPRALRLARRLVDDFGDDLPARLTLGNVYALMGSFEEAKDSFDAALSREPLCVEARLFLGIAALQAGHLEDAKVELTRALFLEPTLSLGHYLLGQVHERRKDLEPARRAYRNAMKHRKAPTHELIGHFPELPRSNDAVAQSAQYRLAAISEQ
jgi:chemotaxis protein methyltransferase CheR